MSFETFDREKQKASILSFAKSAVSNYSLEVSSLECINFEFNATFKVTTMQSENFALRININSRRSSENLAAEIEFVRFLSSTSEIVLPTPVALKDGRFFGSSFHADSERNLNYVLYSWLKGEEIGDRPTLSQVRGMGELMAKMHNATESLEFSRSSSLDLLRDPLWHQKDNLTSESSSLGEADKVKVSKVLGDIDEVMEELYSIGSPQPIHADLHGWNVLEHQGQLAVLDFDDCAIGYPIQDIATSLYYLDYEEQDTAFLAGYAAIREVPSYSQRAMKLLLMQRRLVLLNYLLETSNPEHREMAPKYLAETIRRIDALDS